MSRLLIIKMLSGGTTSDLNTVKRNLLDESADMPNVMDEQMVSYTNKNTDLGKHCHLLR